MQLIDPLQRLKSTRLIFAVLGGDQFVEEDVGVAAANLAGGHRADPGVVVAVPLPQRRVPAIGCVMASQSVPRVVGHGVEVIHGALAALGGELPQVQLLERKVDVRGEFAGSDVGV